MSYSPPSSSVRLQTTPHYFVVLKAANTLVYFSLVYLTWRFLTHHLDWRISTGCVVISACWLIITRIKIDHLLQTYFDILSRIELQLPVVLGLMLSVVAVFAPVYHPYFHIAAIGEIMAWIYIYWLYRRNKSRFKEQGYGPVPRNTWVKPPASVLKAGDLLLTSGNIAKELHESVGHAEMVIKMPDGRKMLFSSYMDKGTILHPIEDLTGPGYKGYYIGLHLTKPWTKDQELKAAEIAREMVRANEQWAKEETDRVIKRIDALPLPESWKTKIKSKIKISGYDWFGTFMGRVAHDRWTCIGAALELYHRMGVQTNHYGTGLLGFGTSIFDPILPVRFLSDPAFKLIAKDEQESAGADSTVKATTS